MNEGAEPSALMNRELIVPEDEGFEFAKKINPLISEVLLTRGHTEKTSSTSRILLPHQGDLLPSRDYRLALGRTYDAISSATIIRDIGPKNETLEPLFITGALSLVSTGGLSRAILRSSIRKNTVQRNDGNGLLKPIEQTDEQMRVIAEDVRQQSELGSSGGDTFLPAGEVFKDLILSADRISIDKSAHFIDDNEHEIDYIVSQSSEYERKRVNGRLKAVPVMATYALQVLAKFPGESDDGYVESIGFAYQSTVRRKTPLLPSFRISGSYAHPDPVEQRRRSRELFVNQANSLQGESFYKLGNGALTNLSRLARADSTAIRTIL